MQKHILSLIPVFFSITAFCQGDLKNGFIINLAQDTIAGRIDFGNPDNAHKHCVFKPDDSSQWTTYTPSQLRGYRINDGQYFISKQIPGDSRNAAFVEVLATGGLALYRFEDKFFVQKEGAELVELVEEMVPMDVKEAGKLKTKLVYSTAPLETLNALMSDCKKAQVKLKPAKLSEDFLIAAVQTYNECSEHRPGNYYKDIHGVTRLKMKLKPIFSFGVAGGGSYYKASFLENTFTALYVYSELSDEAFNPAYGPTAGLSMEVKFPALTRVFSFVLTPSISSYSHQIFQEGVDRYYPHPYRVNLTFQQKKITIPIGFRCKLPLQDFSPFISAGVSKTFATFDDITFVTDHVEFNKVYISNEKPEKVKTRYSGYWIGIGLEKNLAKHISSTLDLRYDISEGNFFQKMTLSVSTYYLTLTIKNR
jgi:hypothetical protein